VATEVLDNLPFDQAERREGRWLEVVADVDDTGDLVERLGPPTDALDLDVDAPDGARIPIQQAAVAWLGDVIALGPARVVVIDYADTTESMAQRPWTDWVRTYRGHQRGGHPLTDLGAQDITVEVAIDQLAAVRPPTTQQTQADFLHAHGIDELVEEGRRTWAERAHVGDLAAVRARSRVSEAAALTDTDGLGSFTVLQWVRPDDPPKGGTQ
jgi:SAM-dependent MidA family methyltransferase